MGKTESWAIEELKNLSTAELSLCGGFFILGESFFIPHTFPHQWYWFRSIYRGEIGFGR